MVAEEPLREERWRLLALALYRAQRQADALGALRRARTTLADELGRRPGPGAARAGGQVLAQSPALARAPASGAPAASGTGAPAPAAPDDLVDRDRELRRGPRRPRRPGRRRAPAAAHRGPGRHRQDPAARRGPAAGRRAVGAGAHRPRQPAGEGVRLRRRPPAVRARARRRRPSAGRAARRGGGQRRAASSTWRTGDAGRRARSPSCTGCTGWRSTSPPPGRWCSPSTTCSGATAPRCAASPTWSAGSRRCRCWSWARCAPASSTTTRSCSPSCRSTRRRSCCGPAPLSAGGDRRPGRRAGSAQPVSPLFATACHRTTSGNPLLLRQLLRALEADGVRPDAAHADRVVAVGSRAVSSMVLMRLRRLPGAVDRRGPGGRRARGRRRRCRPSPRSPELPEARDRRRAGRAGPRPRSSRTSSRWPSCTRWSATPSTATCRRPSGSCGTSAPRELLRAAGAQRRAGRRAPAARPDAAATRARSRCCGRAARTAADRGASDSAVTYLRRALAEPPTGPARRDVLVELGLVETQLDGAASARAPAAGLPLHEDPRARAELAIAIARTQVFASPPGVATAFAREAAAALPAGARRPAAGAARARADQRVHARPRPRRLAAAGPPPEPDGDGPRRPDAGRHARLRDD